MQLERNHIDKFDFLKTFKFARVVVLSLSNIRSEFVATKLVPYNSKRVLSRL